MDLLEKKTFSWSITLFLIVLCFISSILAVFGSSFSVCESGIVTTNDQSLTAHILKFMAYVIPFIGLTFYYIRTNRRQATHQDVLKEKEKTLNETISSLEVTTKSLKEFAYTASHDLKEPLRAIVGFSTLLEDEYKDRLDDEGKMYINTIVDGTNRMRGLIDDILEYSMIGENDVNYQLTDMNELVKNVLYDFKYSFAEFHSEIVVDNLPYIECVRSAVSQILHNFISNSIKFKKVDGKLSIHISAKEVGDYWEFCIKDNGIGIAEKSIDKIWEVFKRLHSREEYSGTGIGLAVCRRVVEEIHKGKVWVESVEGDGTSFYFSLPKKLRID